MLRPAFLTLAAATLAAGSAHAADTACVVTLSGGPDEGAAWSTAVASLEKSLPREASPADCAELSVSLRAEGAELRFATRDGRSTRRALAAPDELAPTVQALRVSYGLPVVVASAEEPDDSDEPPPTAETAPIAVDQKVDQRVPTPVSYALMLGTRGDNELHSPTIEGIVGFAVGMLDLGAMLRVEGHYTNDDDSTTKPETTAVGLGIHMGGRLPLGPTTIAVGGHIMLAAFHREGENESVNNTEGRVGAYLNVIAPRRTRTRLRVGVSFESNVAKGGDLTRNNVKIMPGWALLLALGVEYGEP